MGEDNMQKWLVVGGKLWTLWTGEDSLKTLKEIKGPALYTIIFSFSAENRLLAIYQDKRMSENVCWSVSGNSTNKFNVKLFQIAF